VARRPKLPPKRAARSERGALAGKRPKSALAEPKPPEAAPERSFWLTPSPPWTEVALAAALMAVIVALVVAVYLLIEPRP
jgi:hypothetical protein